ncbi:MAG: hypothetical protein AB7H80_05775 [Candidatus Kapaibacterium sp.]
MPYYDDNGNELNPDLITRPALCIGCLKNEPDDPMEEVHCNLNRLDYFLECSGATADIEFICGAFVPLSSS